MTRERFIEIMDEDSVKSWEGDNAYQGLVIMSRYTDTLIGGAGHDIIWGPGVDELIEKGITEEEVLKLRSFNWMVEEDEYMACFV